MSKCNRSLVEPELVLATTNAIEALKIIQTGTIDLVFLDVQMPEITGIELIRIINGTKTRVVLTTAFKTSIDNKNAYLRFHFCKDSVSHAKIAAS